METKRENEKLVKQSAEEILMLLAGLQFQVMRMLSHREMELPSLQKLTEATLQIRDVLAEWKEAEIRRGKNSHLIGLIDGMKGNFLDLEGLLKEARNSQLRQSETKQ